MKDISIIFTVVRENRFLYCVIVSLLLVIVTLIVNLIKQRINKNINKSQKIFTKKEKNKTRVISFIRLLILDIILCVVPIIISTYFPYKENKDIKYDGVLKLSFYEVRFTNKSLDHILHPNKEEFPPYVTWDDVVPLSEEGYLNLEISPTVYITVYDLDYNVILETKSEYTHECLISLNYGDYILKVSSEYFQDYSVNFSLTDKNKIANIWHHDINLIPNKAFIEDVIIKVEYENGQPFANKKVSVGYINEMGDIGTMLNTFTNSNGIIEEVFTFTVGDYYLEVSEDLPKYLIPLSNYATDIPLLIVRIDNNTVGKPKNKKVYVYED